MVKPWQGIVEKYGLALQTSGFFSGYDININAGIANSVSSSALNFVASMIPNVVTYYETVSHQLDTSVIITETI